MEIFLLSLFALLLAYGGYKFTQAIEKGKKREDTTPTYTPPVSQYKAPSETEPYPDPIIVDDAVRDYTRPVRKPSRATESKINEAKPSSNTDIPSQYNAAFYGTAAYGSAGSWDSGSSSSSSSSCDSSSSSSSSSDSGSSSCDSGGGGF